jgi:hypothetical protein
MRLRHIEVFHAIMQVGTISGAAQVLHISQPAVTKVLQHAELQLGMPLFERVRGKLYPKPEAHRLFAETEKLNRDLQGIRRLAASLKGRAAKRCAWCRRRPSPSACCRGDDRLAPRLRPDPLRTGDPPHQRDRQRAAPGRGRPGAVAAGPAPSRHRGRADRPGHTDRDGAGRHLDGGGVRAAGHAGRPEGRTDRPGRPRPAGRNGGRRLRSPGRAVRYSTPWCRPTRSPVRWSKPAPAPPCSTRSPPLRPRPTRCNAAVGAGDAGAAVPADASHAPLSHGARELANCIGAPRARCSKKDPDEFDLARTGHRQRGHRRRSRVPPPLHHRRHRRRPALRDSRTISSAATCTRPTTAPGCTSTPPLRWNAWWPG